MSDSDRRKPNEESGDLNKMSRGEEYFEGATLEPDEMTFREGLPDDYRMRHEEEHYVDELVAAGSMPQLRLIPVSEIEGGFGSGGENLDGLIDSIQAYGVLQPLLVRRLRSRYELLAGSKRLTAAVNAGLNEVPCLVHEVDDIEARRLAEAANRRASDTAAASSASLRWSTDATVLVAGSLDTILSTLGLFDNSDSSLRDRVAVGLIRAEALRANRLMRGLEILRTDPALARHPVDAATILKNVLTASEDERGLLGIELQTKAPSSCPILADEELVAMAMAGAIETILALLRSSRGGTISLDMTLNELTNAVHLTVSEDAVRMPTSSWSHWFDPHWDERPGGFGAAVSLLAAKRAAELHNGRLEIAPTAAGGCRLTMALPADTA
ncbi:MAG: hypothetical protein BMS9Abin37_1877 [Acidobacteriota bacterium]|nr:MAG: hypothetical protein BMS9Abin37_1877 [Acidobacteriota bacterium]